jgi:DNA-binding MarR family transcriptional regulator
VAGPSRQLTEPLPGEANPATFWPVWDEFFAAVRRARGRGAREFDGLTISQYHLLCAVERAPESGPCELAHLVGASAPTVTRMLTALERTGVVERAASARGQRRVCVTLTAHGQELLHAKRAQMNAARAKVYATLSPEERAQLQQILPRLADALDAL